MDKDESMSEPSKPRTSGTVQRRTFTTPLKAASQNVVGRSTGGPSKRLHSAFKSPFRAMENKASSENNTEALTTEVAKMMSREKELDEEIKQLRDEGYKLEELDNHIRVLHDYNEIKDVGQMLLGQIAMQRGVTTRDLYREYGLGLED